MAWVKYIDVGFGETLIINAPGLPQGSIQHALCWVAPDGTQYREVTEPLKSPLHERMIVGAVEHEFQTVPITEEHAARLLAEAGWGAPVN